MKLPIIGLFIKKKHYWLNFKFTTNNKKTTNLYYIFFFKIQNVNK